MPKQLVRFAGETLVRRSARLLLACTEEVVVVTGASADRVGSGLSGLPVRVEHNENWRHGMGGSIATGMHAVSEDAGGLLVLLCDQWKVDAEDLESLVRDWRTEPRVGICASWNGHFGPPAIFPARMFPDLARLRGEGGARGLIAAHPEFRRLEMPNARLDLDTEEDLRALQGS
jgi:molybdenum cofactor cytidylyltransferase